jgi:uncharacterized protein (DUF1810 family)
VPFDRVEHLDDVAALGGDERRADGGAPVQVERADLGRRHAEPALNLCDHGADDRALLLERVDVAEEEVELEPSDPHEAQPVTLPGRRGRAGRGSMWGVSDSGFPDLVRFLEAQDSGGTYATALAELRRGRKTSHWMWFVFPQIAGLGQSPTAVYFGVRGLDEARAYLQHQTLGARLVECADVLCGLDETDPVKVFGGIDALKLRSSMTLFANAAADDDTRRHFSAVLDQYFGGEEDSATLARI